jgi:hypothetical protein
MTKILVKNGDWDKARSDLGAVLNAQKNSFNAQFEAAFGAPRKPAPAPVQQTPVKSTGQLVLSRSSRRG